MKHKHSPGEVFQPGEVWESPKGQLWKVLEYAYRPGKPKQALMRLGEGGTGRKAERDWDGVCNWVLHMHADGTRTDLLNAFFDLGDTVVQPMQLTKALEARGLGTDTAASLIEDQLQAGVLFKTELGGYRLKPRD